MRNAHATMSPRSCFTSSIVPATVPPVARRSSTMRTFARGCRPSLGISSVADPYSRSYSTDTTSAGSFPSLRTGTKPTPSLYAIGAPKMKPRDSIPTTASIFRGPIRSRSPSIDALKESPSLRSVVMSLKRIPGLGKSGTSRILLARSFVCTAMALEISVRADGDEARPPHPLLPAGVLRAHRAERRRLLFRREPHRPADHPLQRRALLRGHRADDGRRQAPRGHGPRGHRRRGPLALDPQRLLRRGQRADRRRAHGERRVRRPHREAARAVPGLRFHPDGRPRRRASRARARSRRAAPAGRRAPLEHPWPRARGPGLPAVLRGVRPAESLRVPSPHDPGPARALRRVRARPDRGLPVRHHPGGRASLLRRRLQAAAEHPLAHRPRGRRDPVPPGAPRLGLAGLRGVPRETRRAAVNLPIAPLLH